MMKKKPKKITVPLFTDDPSPVDLRKTINDIILMNNINREYIGNIFDSFSKIRHKIIHDFSFIKDTLQNSKLYADELRGFARLSEDSLKSFMEAAERIAVHLNSIKDCKFYSNPNINLEENKKLIVEFSNDKWRKIIENTFRQTELIYNLNSREFEEFIAELFVIHGHKVRLTSVVKDGGKDLLVFLKDPMLGELLYYVECKKYRPSNPVGVAIVRAFYGIVHSSEDAHAGMIVTSSRFTKSAFKEARDKKYKLEFRDYEAIFKWIESAVKIIRGEK